MGGVPVGAAGSGCATAFAVGGLAAVGGATEGVDEAAAGVGGARAGPDDVGAVVAGAGVAFAAVLAVDGWVATTEATSHAISARSKPRPLQLLALVIHMPLAPLLDPAQLTCFDAASQRLHIGAFRAH